ncbi:MAG: hypothetical protein KDC36_06610 [Thermoleophilia bacterium]|nr:hypothetical protein [Thermoleophilia bacterium]
MLITRYIATLVAVIVSVDVPFLRDRFWEGLITNIGIVVPSAVVSLVRFHKR